MPQPGAGSGRACCIHAQVSEIVCSSGRTTSPAATARLVSAASMFSAAPSVHSGGRLAGPATPSNQAGSTQVSRVPAGPTAATVASSRSPNPKGGAGEALVNGPATARSQSPIVKSPWSRASMTCIGASYGPGASTSPPAAIRRTHQVKRRCGRGGR